MLDQYQGRYHELRGVPDFGEYVSSSQRAADEETLTEPMLASILEDVLGFGKGDYFPQLGKSGLKPDFTPTDLVTHRFVMDAKGTSESLSAHVAQISRYVDQRALRHGVLFNGKQMRVYPSGANTFDRTLSFDLLPLWRAARGEQLPVGPDFHALDAFLTSFSHRTLTTADKIERIRREESWTERLESATVDVEFLVEQLRQLARALADDAGAQIADLETYVDMSPDRLTRLNDELRLLALDIEPGVDIERLPSTIAGWRGGGGTIERVWRQYLLRVAYLAVTRILLYRAWEDVGFVDEMLYDGGFDTAYERLDESVRDVLNRAFLFGSEKYRTLFTAENNYAWYRPSEDVLVDVLYRLGAIPLGRLDQDALGELYVSYVDEIDRDRLGQFFTPRDVVRFMLDRAGFVGKDVFRLEGDERLPLRVFDFATGSGGFLVEAA
ncbi:MAG: N-6 DNA methylase, partial [Gaiellaceae bacterium]